MRKISLRTSLLIFAGSLAIASGIFYCTWLAPNTGVQARTVSPQTTGNGVVTVESVGGSCVTGTPPQAGGPYNWEVVQGGTYKMTITGVTECEGDTITVFVQNSNTGNFCFNATGGNGTYVGTFTMPNPACFTSPVSYKCGANAACNNNDTYDAQGPSGAKSVHLRASTFDGSCNRTGTDEDCSGCTPDGKPEFPNCPTGGDLGCNPESIPGCDHEVKAKDSCGDITPTCDYKDSNDGCIYTRKITYTAKNSAGTTTCEVTYTWKVDTTKPELPTLPRGGDLGCNPSTLPSCATGLTAHDGCDGSVPVMCTAGSVETHGCNKSQKFTYSATDSCGKTASQDVTYTWKEDMTPPVITCNADGTASAWDNCDGAITPTLKSTKIEKNTPCFGKTTITRVWEAMDSCGKTSTKECVQVTGECVPGCSYTVGAYKNSGAPSAYVPSSLTVGVGNTLTFNSKAAIQAYLKVATGTPGQLTGSFTNPTTIHGEGIFGGQVVALKINVGSTVPNPIGGFHLCDVNTSLLSSKGATLTSAQAAALDGKTVNQILADAEKVLGGGSSGYGLSVSQMNALVTLLNESFDNCLLSAWAKTYMCP